MREQQPYTSFATPTASRPELQPVVDAMAAWLRHERLTPMMACERIYGRTANGKALGISQIYGLLAGRNLPTAPTLRRFREHNGPDLEAVVVAVGKEISAHGRPAALTPVRAAVAAYDAAAKEPATVLEPPRRRAAPAFALTIGDDGRASLDLHLADVDAEIALRCLEILRAAGLLRKD